MKSRSGSVLRRWADWVNEATKWSTLSRIGSSAPAKLTILAPFIGYFIVYNDIVIEIFNWTGSGGADGNSVEALDSFSRRRLHYFYFGLLLFGLASALFSFFAPRQISHFKTVESFVLGMEEIKTRALTISSLDKVLQKFVLHNRGETSSPFLKGASLSFPEVVQEPLFNTIDSIFEEQTLVDYDSHQGADRFHTGSGYIESEQVIDLIYSRRRAERSLWEEMLETSFKSFSKDIFYLDFLSSEYENIAVRLICSAFFTIGAVLLLVPTIITSIMVFLS